MSNKHFLLSLSNIVINKNKITISFGTVDPTYFFEPDYVPPVAGPCGWYGPGRDKPPEHAYSHNLLIDIPKEKIASITKILEGSGFSNKSLCRHYEDNGLRFNIFDKLIKTDVIKHERQIVKQPWFDKLLNFMITCDPSYTEEKLIDIKFDNEGYEWWNSCAVINIRDAYNETVKVYDDKLSTLNISIMNNDIINNMDKLNAVIGLIFSII